MHKETRFRINCGILQGKMPMMILLDYPDRGCFSPAFDAFVSNHCHKPPLPNFYLYGLYKPRLLPYMTLAGCGTSQLQVCCRPRVGARLRSIPPADKPLRMQYIAPSRTPNRRRSRGASGNDSGPLLVTLPAPIHVRPSRDAPALDRRLGFCFRRRRRAGRRPISPRPGPRPALSPAGRNDGRGG